jgi:hypothetical protein
MTQIIVLHVQRGARLRNTRRVVHTDPYHGQQEDTYNDEYSGVRDRTQTEAR